MDEMRSRCDDLLVIQLFIRLMYIDYIRIIFPKFRYRLCMNTPMVTSDRGSNAQATYNTGD